MTKCCYGYKWGSDCCSVHTWNDNLRDSLPHLNEVVTPETCSVYVDGAFVMLSKEKNSWMMQLNFW